MKFLKFFTLILFVLATHSVVAQLNFVSSVSKNELGVNQRLKIEFSVDKQGADNFVPPSFNNFRIVAGPSSSVSQSWINGKTSYIQSYIYILEPKSEGEFTIGSATIQYNGATVKSNSVKVTVTKAVPVPKDPNNPEFIAQQNIHLVAEVSNLHPYVGEGIYVVYKLYVSQNISVNGWQVTDAPQYNGFWNQDIDIKDANVEHGKYNGEDYRYLVLKKAILIPQRAGKLVIEPIKMDFSVGIPTGRGDFFGNMITQNVSYSTQSLVKEVDVKDLPTKGKPADFSGAVGDFQMSVTSSKSELKANEASQVKVSITGSGNLKLFDIPKITTPTELELYTPEHNEQVQTSLYGLKGTISDNYTVVPHYKGKYKIPEVSFSYFNTREGKYETLKSDPIILDVTQGEDLPTNSQVLTDKQHVVTSGTNFKFIALNTTFEPISKEDFFNTSLFYWLLFLPLIAIPLGIFIGKKQEERANDIFGNKIRRADKLAKRYLSEAKKQLGKKEEFYISLEKALHNFFKAKLQIETFDMSKENIGKLLETKGVEAATITSLFEVLNDCDFARYTPTTNVMMQQEFEKAKDVIAKLDKYL